MFLLDHRERWLDVAEVARCTDLTVRQVLSILATIDAPYLCKRKEPDGVTVVMFSITEDEAERVRKEKKAERFGFTEAHFEEVRGAMSPAGWMSIGEIAEDTGFNRTNVARMLPLMDGVALKEEGDRKYYIRSI